jgi:hypothetical protein
VVETPRSHGRDLVTFLFGYSPEARLLDEIDAETGREGRGLCSSPPVVGPAGGSLFAHFRPPRATESHGLSVSPHKEIRAMDRRRFVPSHEDLEGRALQTTNLTSIFGAQITSNLNIPITYQQKALRILRLPYYLDKISEGNRFLPKAEISQIQNSLFAMLDKIEKPPSEAINNYNYQLRHVISHQSLSTSDIKRLDYSFGAVLKSAKTPVDAINGLKSALFTLVSQVDTASVLPVTLATNDYSLTLQTALGIGRPMPPPIVPRIKKNNGIQAGVNHMKTPLMRPRVVGTYHFHTFIRVVTPDGEVVGASRVKKNNNYTVQIVVPQSIGIHEFRLQAVDDVGNLSKLSRPFKIKVVPKRHH